MAYKNLPDLRFSEFSGKWKQEKFNNFVKRISETSSSNQYKKIEFSDIDSGILKNKLRNNDSKGIKFLKKDVLFGKLRPYLKNWYYCNFDGIAIGDFWVYRAKKDYSNSTFIYYLIQTEKYNLVANYTTGTKMPRSDWNIVSNTLFGLPSFNEQQKIGSFFEKLDKLIELQTQKLDQLKKLKRGYLQKMFPQKGETVPRLRFSGFSGEWKEDRLGNYSHIIGGGTPSTSNDKYWNGNINWFSPIEIGKNKYVSNSTKKISDIGLKNSSAKILPKGSLLFTSRAGIGKTAILLKEACTNQGFQSIVPIDGRLDIEFLYAISYKLKNYGNKMGSGSTFTEVSGKTMSKMKLRLPNVNEQKKIGNFFAKLDRLIEEQSNKLDQLKQQKKAYLQKMFI
ncbi:hypothetical protein AKUH3B101J_09150 [Apilactobacillus kunkeei]|nr:hypothetical protein AKUH3B104J_09150 [Apilactobacillus kunkeei]CAI2616782.1 hypothetical protein AKUH3B101J_09150 [Apilactobacillus kunkeei]